MTKVVLTLTEVDGKESLEVDFCGAEFDEETGIHKLVAIMLSSIKEAMTSGDFK